MGGQRATTLLAAPGGLYGGAGGQYHGSTPNLGAYNGAAAAGGVGLSTNVLPPGTGYGAAYGVVGPGAQDMVERWRQGVSP